jgi:hypothetical protein
MEKYNWDGYKNPDGKTFEEYGFIQVAPNAIGMNVYVLKNGETYVDYSNICPPSQEDIAQKISVNPWVRSR